MRQKHTYMYVIFHPPLFFWSLLYIFSTQERYILQTQSFLFCTIKRSAFVSKLSFEVDCHLSSTTLPSFFIPASLSHQIHWREHKIPVIFWPSSLTPQHILTWLVLRRALESLPPQFVVKARAASVSESSQTLVLFPIVCTPSVCNAWKACHLWISAPRVAWIL